MDATLVRLDEVQRPPVPARTVWLVLKTRSVLLLIVLRNFGNAITLSF